MIEALVNKGVTIVGKQKSEKSPIVVVGTARGGTSMVAGALVKLGVFMGDLAIAPVFEDLRLSKAMESKDFLTAKQIASEYGEKHPRWGWKRPSSIEYLDDVDSVLGSPAYVFIYKDILSIAQRNAISMLSDILPGMEVALRKYGMSLEFLRKNNPYAMLVSYDKAVAYPESFVLSLIKFCRLSPSEQQINDAVAFITPNPAEYLDATRITKAYGRLDGFSLRIIFGWARLAHSRTPAEVMLYLNDQPIATVKADKPRPDLKEKFGQDCAFVYELPEEIALKPGDRLRARVVNDVRDLNNSPIEISPQAS